MLTQHAAASHWPATIRHMARTLDATRTRRLLHAGRVRAARRLLDALAGAAGQLAPRRAARAARVRRGGHAPSRVSSRSPWASRAAHFEFARAQLPAQIRVVEMIHDDAWMRDVGPTFVINETRRAPRRRLALQCLGRPRGRPVFSVGPGRPRRAARCSRSKAAIAIARRSSTRAAPSTSTAQGTALVTEQVLLNPNRNPDLGRDADRAPAHGLSRRADRHLAGRGRHRRRDRRPHRQPGLLRPARRGGAHWTDDKRDPQYAVSRDALERLAAARDARGRRLEVIKLPMPGPLRYTAGRSPGVQAREACRGRIAGMRLAASYVNFYIANGGIVMPLLDPRTDKRRRREAQARFSGPQGGRRAGARDPVRRRQHSLHHAAGAARLTCRDKRPGEPMAKERRRDAIFPTHCA